MIPFDEAFDRMMAAALPLPSETVALENAVGRILAEDVNSDMDMPPFDKSARDGYACRRQDLQLGELEIVEEIAAGVWPRHALRPGTCARIFTGAPLPEGADCVVMQEQTERRGMRVRLLDSNTLDNTCAKGEDIRAGDRVLCRGERITPAHIAVLASVGVAHPVVARRPRVAILATGSELVEPHATPGPGQIRNSNGWQLAAQVRAAGALSSYRGVLADREEVITAAIAEAMKDADLLLLSGGVSVGDHDLVPGILETLGFSFSFDSVAMQPGRPTVFGRNGEVYCCGLPGNPVSTFVVFELLVKPFLCRLMGHDFRPLLVEARLVKPIRRRATQRRLSFPVRFVSPGEVEPIDYHGAAHINAMSQADGIVALAVGQSECKEGTTVHVRSLSS